MKRLYFTVLLCLACGGAAFAQTNAGTLVLRADNIEEILQALTAAAWETAAGTYQVQFGASVTDIRAVASCKIKAQAWPVKAIW